MKRRVVLHGPCTLTVSLPMNWVKKFDIKKGDELNVEENGCELRVAAEKQLTSQKKEISVGSLEQLGKTYLTSLYRQGYDEISFSYDDSSFIEDIRDLISKELIGFEIIQQKTNTCLIKDLTKHSDGEFDTGIKRIWLLLLDLAEEAHKAMKANDSEHLSSVQLMDHNINKFSNYCLRLLSKKGFSDFRKTSLYFAFIRELEELGDRYKDLCKFCLTRDVKFTSAFLSLFLEVNSHIGELHDLFYNFNETKAEELVKKIKATYRVISGPQSTDIDIYLSSICKNLTSILQLLTELHL